MSFQVEFARKVLGSVLPWSARPALKIEDAPSSEPVGKSGSWPTRFVDEMGQAARGGWAYTIRLAILILIVSGSLALIVAASR
jgi:hypothetical protein